MGKVEITTSINTTPENVIRAFMDGKMLSEWWGVERSLIEEKVGGLYTLAWNITEKGFGFVSSGTIKQYDPARVLEIDRLVYLNPERPILGPTTLLVETKSIGAKTELYLCQSGYQHGPDWDWYYDAVNQAWPTVATTLKDYLENKV